MLINYIVFADYSFYKHAATFSLQKNRTLIKMDFHFVKGKPGGISCKFVY